MKVTKEKLVKENSMLEGNVLFYEKQDTRLRKEFTGVLGVNCRQPHMREPDTLSWEEIFFKMGELKAEANYHMILESRDILHRENIKLKTELDQLRDTRGGL